MFLTQMNLNPARRGTRSLLGSPQRMHAAVMLGFPPGSTIDGPEGRVLWRVDHSDHAEKLWISSPSKPDLTHIVEQAGWPTAADPWRSVQTDGLLDRLATGQEWIFRLTANPVVSVKQESGRGKRVPWLRVEEQVAWLESRSSRLGFGLTHADVTRQDEISFHRGTDGTNRKVTLNRATIDGVLTVTDPALFRTALTHGVGKAKGYGCGLLTLAPLR